MGQLINSLISDNFPCKAPEGLQHLLVILPDHYSNPHSVLRVLGEEGGKGSRHALGQFVFPFVVLNGWKCY